MRRLALAAFFVMAFFATAMAHNGAISLYIDETLTQCSATIGLFETVNLNLYYVKGSGAEMGKAAEFRMMKTTSGALVQGSSATWNPSINVTIGDVETGISITSNVCLGVGQTVVWLGTIPVMDVGDADTFQVRVVPDPGGAPPGTYITLCDAQATLYSVLGGTFVFNGSCNPGVETKTWGSIKELYR